MIRIENLVKHYGEVLALDGLSLNVEPGVVYGFLGPNGAGKTTTMRILSGLARPTQGRAWILDQEIGQVGTDVRKLIGVLPEEPAFYTWMTAREYLRDFTAPLYGIEKSEASRRAEELLETVGLAEAGKRRIGGFSRGMRQRLGLAQALVHRPKVLLLDEPVSALDPSGRKEVLDLIETLRGEITILLSTHILADVERVCDVVGIINQGKMIIQAHRDELLAGYALPIIEVEGNNGTAGWVELFEHLPCVENIQVTNATARMLVKDVISAQKELLKTIVNSGIAVRRFEIVRPSLEDVFLQLTHRETKSD
ncbi:MAG: ABC transporter ATP-binding protein [Chloroflexota bacterium]|nr:MAG: ABC transporter ATP-binding protein [Chloroflexota bacterium]